MDPYLFKYRDGLIAQSDFLQKLRSVGADECDVLYIHAGIQFGLPNLQLGRLKILEAISKVLYELKVGTLIMPSYTFSFCNGEVFDRQKSISPMGALNEYFRLNHGWLRSCDPLMSNILYGSELGLLTNIGKESVGKESTFDLMTNLGMKVKFLFFGTRIHECFTYMHYLEAIRGVEYRYRFPFSGLIVDGARRYDDTYNLFIRDCGVEAGDGARIYENLLVERGIAKFQIAGNSSISCVELKQARDVYLELLNLSSSFYIKERFTKATRPKNFKQQKLIAL